jgi:acetyl-CoA carboxylase biotin carboxyl carrier protein
MKESMDISVIKKLVKLVEESSITELEVEEKESRIKVVKQPAGIAAPHVSLPSVVQLPHHVAGHLPPVPAEVKPAEAPAAEKTDAKLHEVRSPIVGIFYRAPAPDADPYVRTGDRVSAGQPLCIIEAMKLMNEIECDVDGTVVKLLVENGRAVEYNQPLFLIEVK